MNRYEHCPFCQMMQRFPGHYDSACADQNAGYSRRREVGLMSYDIYLVDPVTKNTLNVDMPHQIGGGTQAIGGTTELWLNVTYNYSKHLYRVLGEKGIRSLYGQTGAQTIPILKEAISKLADDVDPDYWKATEGNVKQALAGLLAFAQLRPDGVWEGD